MTWAHPMSHRHRIGPRIGRHLLLTTGDVRTFAGTASRLFGDDLGSIEGVVLDEVASAAGSAAGVGSSVSW